MKPFKSLLRMAFPILLVAGSALAQQSLIILVSPGLGPTVDSNYQLNSVRYLNATGEVQRVRFADAGSMSNFIAAASSDPMILSIESEQQAQILEAPFWSQAANSYVSTTVDPLTAGDPTVVNFFGNPARQGYVQQPEAIHIRVPDAQALYGAGSGIVADIDTGVDATHPLLANVFVPGYDFIAGTPGIPSELSDLDQSTVVLLDGLVPAPVPTSDVPFILNQSTVVLLDQSTVVLLDQSTVVLLDSQTLPVEFGHGTMVSGLIHLVAPGAQIMPLRAFHSDGTGNLSDVVSAIYYAVDNGANVINMSFSSTTTSPALTQAIRYANANNVICVAAAGNEGQHILVYPAAIGGVISVGSTDLADLRSSFSNYGWPTARLGAPGEALITSFPFGQYAGAWGTSFSVPLVSGAVALGYSANPQINLFSAMFALNTGQQLPWLEGLGHTRLDVLSFLNALTTGF